MERAIDRHNAELRALAARFRGTRRAHRDETGEDYVEAISQILATPRSGAKAEDRPGARVRDLAAMMGVSHVTVVRTIARLTRRGLVESSRGRGVDLTKKGEALAGCARQRHEAVLAFLLAIGVPEKQAAVDAEGIEHHVSDATVRAFKRVTKRSRV